MNKEEHIKLIVRAIRGMESSEETTIGPLFAAEDPKQQGLGTQKLGETIQTLGTCRLCEPTSSKK